MPKLRTMEARMVMYDLYETKFGIHSHLKKDNKNRPLAPIAMNSCEDINTGSLLENVIRSFAQGGIKETFGLNLIEFLELPTDIAEMLMEVANEVRSSNNNTLTDIEKSFTIPKK